MGSIRRALLTFLFIFGPLSLAHLSAQGGSSGIISGTVTDASGAVVPNAKVEIKSTETGVSDTLTTTSAGDYYSPPLHPGMYQVTVTQAGFQVSQSSPLQLTVDQKARVNITLQAGSTSETIQVNTSSVELNTDTAEISTTITSKQVLDLPINSRNFASLLFLSPGVVQTGGESGGNNGTSSAKGNGAISINGNRSSSNQYLIDGMYNNDTVYQTPAISPSIDAVQEFKTQSGAYSAEFGGSANQVNISFRSGGNAYHGTAFEFLRNDAFDAKSRYDDPTARKPLLRQNQFGYTLGGPITIPHVYHGRDKTFFFANYEGIRLHSVYQVRSTVPTQAELGIGTPNGAAIIPQSAVDGGVCPTATYANCDNTGLLNPFASYSRFAQDGSGNYIIPDSAISNFARVSRTHIPVPNSTLVQNGVLRNYVANLGTPTVGNQQNYRIDQNFGKKDSIYFRYSRAEFIVTTAGVGLLPEGQQSTPSEQTSYVGQYTRLFTPNLINQVRVGYLSSYNAVLGNAGNLADINKLGLTGLYTLTAPTYPQIGFTANTGNLATFGGAAVNNPEVFDQPTYDATDILTLTRGHHTIGLGGEYRNLTLNDGGNASTGGINFDGQFSNSHIGDFLLGTYQNANVAVPTPYSTPGDVGTVVHIKHYFIAGFIKDDWKANQRLTMNLGVRYDFNSAPYNENNHFGWFDPTGPGYLRVADPALISSGIGGSIYKYAGGRTAYNAQKLTFAPRIGFSFLVTPSTVLRAGFGLYFDSSEDSETRQFAEFYPYSVRQNLNGARTYTSTAAPTTLTSALFPAITSIAPVDPSQLGFLLTQLNQKKNPYIEAYNLSLERSLGARTKLELDYVGNVGRHLEGRNNINQPFAYNPAAPTSVAARTPFSNFGGTIIVDQFAYPSNYNAFNGIVQTQRGGLTLLAAYTWSKSMDLKSASAGVDGDSAGWVAAQDPHNEAAEYARSGYDVGQRVVLSFVDELPIGKGKKLDLHNSVANAVLGGFQLNGIATFQGGFPFSVNANDNSGLNGPGYSERANVVGNPTLPRGQRSAAKWFNTAAFSQPGYALYGNSGRNIVRAPGLNNLDLSAFKNFDIFERLRAQFRLESFNTLNHVQLGAPSSNVTSSSFGTINYTRIPGRIVQLGAKIIF